MGDTILLSCNATQTSGVKWSRNTTRYGFSYVYINGTARGREDFRKRLSVINVGTMEIYNVHPVDSGFYDCYEANGTRIIGYHLVAKRMFF